ncbi:MAG: hypothetical protein ACSLE6_05465 [Mycobacterium sp.]
MTWQPAPQQPAPWPAASYQGHPYAAPSGPYGAYGPPPPTGPRPAFLRWIAGAVVFCLLLTGSYAVHRVVLSRFVGGASSPEDAVRQVISALEDGDLTQLGLLIPPDEVAGISDVATEYSRILSEIDDGSGNAAAALEQSKAFTIEVDDLELDATTEQASLTKVSIENADITVTWDPDELPDSIRDAYFQGAEAGSAEVTIRGAEVTADDDEETLELNGDEQAPFVMTVERDGAWYVSPLFSYFQYASEEGGYGTSPAPTSSGADSPIEAAENFVNGLADSLATEDVTSVADALAGVEGKVLLTYQDLINDNVRIGDSDIAVEDAEFELMSMDGNTARVKPTSLHVSWGRSEEAQWDGQCLAVDVSNDSEQWCTDDQDTLGPFAPLVDNLGYLVAVRADGGWKISVSRTVYTMIADVLSWVGDTEMPILRWLINSDPTELTDAVESAASIDVGDSATVDIEPIGSYVDAGYVLVDIEYSGNDGFSVYCDSSERISCDVTALITPSGGTEPPFYAGDDGDGTYTAVVVGPAGEVEVTAQEW